MDFTQELLAFQGIMLSADNVHSFSRLSAKGGNEEKIQDVIHSITSFLDKTENALVQEKEHMIKFTLYLILNADIPYLKEMVDMEGIHTVIWTIPTIPKCLLSELLWQLHMEKFIYEIIAFCNPQLALQVSNALIENIKYYTPSTCLEKIRIISAACYRLICRLHFFNYENNVRSDLLTTTHNNFQQCLNYFVFPPNAGKLDGLSKDEQYKYKGTCLHTMLDLISECLQQYTTVQEFTPANFNGVYLLTFEIDTLYTHRNSTPSRSQDIFECLDKCHLIMLDKCKDLVMDVSVDIYCAWSEFEENEKNMQQTIGQVCYELREKLLAINSVSEHPLVAMLEQFSRKPVSFDEIINVTDSQTITENITSNINKDGWIHALLLRDKLCHDVALVELLASHVEILNNEERYKLFKVCEHYLNDSPENASHVESLAIKVFQCCDIIAKHEILNERFNEKCFFDMPENNDFNNMMTEIFNKLIQSPDSNLNDILNVFIQSPQKVFIKIFLLALENSQQTEIMLRVMKLLENYSNHYYNHETEPCIIGIIKRILDVHLDIEAKQLHFVMFLSSLKSVNIISGAKLLLLIVMPNLYQALLNNDTGSIHIQCSLLSEAYTLDELKQYRAPVLAMLAQVMEVVRWKLDTFVTLAPSTLQCVLQLQTSLVNTYEAQIPDKEANWLKSKLKNLQPLNKYYYRKLWNQTDNNFVEAVSGMTVNHETDIAQLATWLSLMLCSCTQKELCVIWDNLASLGNTMTLDMLHKVLTLVTETVCRNHTPNTWGCLLNCYKNFMFTIRYKFFEEPLTDGQVSKVVVIIASLANLIDEENIEDTGAVLMPLFAYMVERKDDYTMDVPHSLHNILKHSKFQNMVKKIFISNGTGSD